MDSPTEGRTSYSLAVLMVGIALVILFAGASVILALNHQVPQEFWAAASALSGALVGILIPTPRATPATDNASDAGRITQAAATNAARIAAQEIELDPAQSPAAKSAASAALTTVTQASAATTASDMVAKSATPEEIVDGVIELFAKSRNEAQTNANEAQSAYDTATDAEEQAEPAVQQKVQTAQTELDSSKAALSVHDAAADAASNAKGAATQIAASGAAAITKPPGIPKSTVWIVVIISIVLVLALALALIISLGVLHPSNCPLAAKGKTQDCDSNLLQVGTAVLSLASAAGGTLLGLFATPDGKPAAPATASKTAGK